MAAVRFYVPVSSKSSRSSSSSIVIAVRMKVTSTLMAQLASS
jgi:hypothetical protein